jgi:hypothetical protein
MIKNYSIKGIPFKTIIIPRGTILFRGLNFENEHEFANLFSDLIGVHTGHGRTIAPTMNIPFYPVPLADYDTYNTHAIYITQYNIELIQTTNDGIYSPDIMEYEDCIRERFPQIDGYIKYKDEIIDKITNINHHILPSNGITEIVIHPLRFRHDDNYNIRERFFSTERVINYCIRNRALYNIFPLLYFNTNGIFVFEGLKNHDNIKKLIKGYIEVIQNHVQNIFSKMVDTGYTINNTLIKPIIDIKTGLYTICNDINNYNKTKINTLKKTLRHFEDDDFKGYINTYIIRENNQLINNILSSHKKYINSFLNDLSVNGHTMKKKLIFNRGDKNKFIYNYYIEKVLDRPDLDEYKNIRKKRKNTTLKNINTKFSYMLGLNGFTASDLDDMSI